MAARPVSAGRAERLQNLANWTSPPTTLPPLVVSASIQKIADLGNFPKIDQNFTNDGPALPGRGPPPGPSGMSATEPSNHSQPQPPRTRLRRRVYAVLEPTVAPQFRVGGPLRANPAFLAESFLVLVIIVNSAALVLWTVPELASSYGFWFHTVEYCTVSIFLVEYLLRFWASPESAPNPETAGWRRRWRYLVSSHALVDAAALAPSGVAVLILLLGGGGPSLSFLLTVRLLTRTLKLVRYFPAAGRLVIAIRRKAGQLLTTVVTLAVALIVAATLMYFAETQAQPEVFSSIPAAMWWSVVTLTTVGYGDTVPITSGGPFAGRRHRRAGHRPVRLARRHHQRRPAGGRRRGLAPQPGGIRNRARTSAPTAANQSPLTRTPNSVGATAGSFGFQELYHVVPAKAGTQSDISATVAYFDGAHLPDPAPR